MSVIAFVVGIGIVTLIGWLVLDLLQTRQRVLFTTEQWVMGFVLGSTFSMLCVFLTHITLGVELTFLGFVGVLGVLGVVLGMLRFFLKKPSPGFAPPSAAPGESIKTWMKVVLGATCAWIGVRILAFAGLLVTMPSFFDDTLDNWNLRGKIFFVDQKLTLSFPWEANPGVSSYPPSVPMMKTWLSTIAGEWNEGLINSIHILWFIAVLVLVYFALRRMLPQAWSLLGSAMLASLPLVFVQGVGTYAEMYLSVHLFIVITSLFFAARTASASWLRIGIFALALVPFTKNEGWALYFPVLLFLTCLTIWWLWKKSHVTSKTAMAIGLMMIVCLVFLVAPWIGFKVMNGLAFGNAKGIDFAFAWQPNVIMAVFVNTFLEANWVFLFPLFFGLLVARFKSAIKFPLLLLTLFFAIPYFGQLFAYMTTGLSQEAIYQTGYARGIIHLVPGIVMLTVLLLHELVYSRPWQSMQHSSDTNRT